MKRSNLFSEYHQHGTIIYHFYEKYFDLKKLINWASLYIKKTNIINIDFLHEINLIKPIVVEQNWNNSFDQIIILENVFKKFNFEQNKIAIEEFERINEVETFSNDKEIQKLENQINSYRYVSKNEKYQSINYLQEIIENDEQIKMKSVKKTQFTKNPDIILQSRSSKIILFLLIGSLATGIIIAIIMLCLVLTGVL